MVGYSTGTTLAPPPPTVIWNNSGTAPTCVKYIQPQYSIQTLSDSTATFIPTPGYIEYVSNAAAQLVTNQVYKLVDTNSANGGWGWSCPVWKNAGFTTVATGCTGTGYWQRVEYLPQILLSPRDRLREILRSRHAPAIVLRGEPIKLPADHREQRARETLRMMLGEEKYRRFLTRGFVAIRAKSGLIYRLFPGYRQVEVYKLGALIESNALHGFLIVEAGSPAHGLAHHAVLACAERRDRLPAAGEPESGRRLCASRAVAIPGAGRPRTIPDGYFRRVAEGGVAGQGGGEFMVRTCLKGFAMRDKHSFRFTAGQITAAAKAEAEYHHGRAEHWRQVFDQATARIKDTASIEFQEYPVTGGKRFQAVVKYGDPGAYEKMNTAGGKIDSHRQAADRFATEARVYGSQHADREYELDTADVHYFRLGGNPREE